MAKPKKTRSSTKSVSWKKPGHRVAFRAGDVTVSFEGPATAVHDFVTQLAWLLRDIESDNHNSNK
jgi:hypothetical protein